MILAFDKIKELADKQGISLNTLEERLGYSTNYLYSLNYLNKLRRIYLENKKTLIL